jgi:putative oxygen-independent coproporphyrinogen III oxidase
VAVRHLYVHLPFCAHRCGYCAFVVEVGALDRRDAYTDAVIAELDQSAGQLGTLETVYFGGGTPSLLGAERIARLMTAVAPRCAPGAEVTIEANPETVDRRTLDALRDAGITRISLGAQSFQPQLLTALDRAASPHQVRAAVTDARAAGFDDVSIDLLFGVPGQTAADLDDDLAAAADLRPDHISWYELEVKPGSALARAGAVVDEDFTEDAYHVIVERLEDLGYQWYETANFALPGHECRHSLAYWNAADYLGLGIGAVSTVAARRWRNAPDLDGYVATLSAGGTPRRTNEELDGDTLRRERWMLGLRLGRPLPLDWAGAPDHPESLDQLAALGLLTVTDTTLTLSREGRFVQNAVLCELMEYAG